MNFGMHCLAHMLVVSWQASSSRIPKNLAAATDLADLDRERGLTSDLADVTADDTWDTHHILMSWKENAEFYLGVQDFSYIFKDSPGKLYKILPASTADVSQLWFNSSTDKSSKLQAAVGLQGKGYGYFKGSTQLDIENNIGKNLRYYKLDENFAVEKQQVKMFAAEPHKYLRAQVKEHLRSYTPQKIQEKYGDFFVKSVTLGARVRRTVEVKTNSASSSNSVQNTIQAKMTGVSWRTSGNSDVSLINDALSEDSLTIGRCRVAGGEDNGEWFAVKATDEKSWDQCMSEWSAGLKSAKLSSFVPIRLTLAPLWYLVREFGDEASTAQAAAMESYYRKKWADEDTKIQAWEEKMEERRGQPRSPAWGMIKHSSGQCLGPRGGSDTPKDNTNIEVNRACKIEWKAVPVNSDQKYGGYYVLKHKGGKCLHPWGGWNRPWDGTDMTVHHICDPNKEALWWKPVCLRDKPGWYVMRHIGGKCLGPKGGSPQPSMGTKLEINKAGCEVMTEAVQFKGVDFGLDEPC